MHRHRPHALRRSVPAFVAATLLALACAGTSQGAVVLPSPGAMRVEGLPSHLRAGHTFTLREVLPLAVWFGHVRLQRRTANGWRTLASAAIRPRVFWLHLWVPARWSGARMTVRFVLMSRDETLAVSPGYAMRVTGRRRAGRRR